jgi:hypothetical protein
VKSHRDYHKIEQALNGIDLLRVIKLICFSIEDEKYAPQKVHETKAALYALKKVRDSEQAYQIKFLNTVQVIEQCGASLGEDPLTRSVVCKYLGFGTGTVYATKKVEITKTVGAALILGADPERYICMIRGIKNASLAGQDEWPKNVTEAYNYLSKWEEDDSSPRASHDFEGVVFTNNTREPEPWHHLV